MRRVLDRLSSRYRLVMLQRSLRHLQRDYLDSDMKDEKLILEYLRTLEEARNLYHALRGDDRFDPRRKLHLGAGDHAIEGWINVDRLWTGRMDLVADLTISLPFRSGSVAFIHSEDFIEHVTLEQGKNVLRECHRVLERGGMMRILTPDLRRLVKRLYLARSPVDLRWCAAHFDAHSPCEALNMHLRMDGEHRFIYDEEFLVRLLREIGFAVRPVRFNHSKCPELRFLDLRNFGLNLFLECRKD